MSEVIKTLHPDISYTLEEYIKINFPEHININEKSSNEKELSDFLTKTLIVSKKMRVYNWTFDYSQSIQDMLERLVKNFQYMSKKERGNVLFKGCTELYKQPFMNENHIPSWMNNINSSIHYLLKSQDMKKVHMMVGDLFIEHMILETSIFIHIGNNNYIQISGQPLYDEIPESKVERSSSTHKQENTNGFFDFMNQRSIDFNKPSKITFKKKNIPYKGNIDYFKKTVYRLPNKNAIEIYGKLKTGGRMLMEYILFSSENKKSTSNNTYVKRKWRFKNVLPLFDQIISKNKTCNYKKLLDRYCPFTPFSSTSDKWNVYQVVKSRGSVMPFASNKFYVFAFVKRIVSQIIPKEMWGNTKNYKCILRSIKDIIGLNKAETYSIQLILNKGFNIRKLNWIFQKNSHTTQYRSDPRKDYIPMNEYKSVSPYIFRFIYWFIGDFVFSLIKSHFFVTEISPHKNRLYYFRIDFWRKYLQCYFEKDFKNNIFVKLENKNVSSSYNTITFQPKKQDFRPFTRYGLHVTEVPHIYDLHNKNYGAFRTKILLKILNYEYSRINVLYQDQQNTSVNHTDDIYKRIVEFKHKALSSTYFIVSLDIKSCFNSILQDRLISIVANTLSHKYLIFKYCTLFMLKSKVKRIFRNIPCSTEKFCFFSFACNAINSKGLRNMVFVDQVIPTLELKEDLLNILRNHLNNYSTINHKHYKQIVGIPQGSILSPILSKLYYNSMEHEEFKVFKKNNILIMRYVDDYVCISPDKDLTIGFLLLFINGIKEYNLTVNPSKTTSSFLLPFGLRRDFKIRKKRRVAWCGILIDRKLNVRANYYKTFKFGLNDSALIKSPVKILRFLEYVMISSMKHRIRKIFIDDDILNTRKVVIENIINNLKTNAKRFIISMSKLLKCGVILFVNQKFFYRFMTRISRSTYEHYVKVLSDMDSTLPVNIILSLNRKILRIHPNTSLK